MHDIHPPRVRRLPRWLIRTGMGLVAAYLLYLAAGNVFINTWIGHEVVNRKPEKFRMQWDGGYTLWPGRVRLREVRMQGHARQTQWSVQAGEVGGRVALWPLLRKEIRVPWVRAGTVSGSVARADFALPAPEPASGGWTLRMERIASDSIVAGEVFGWTFAGEGTATTGFSKQMRGGPMALLPSVVEFGNLRLARDGGQWLEGAELVAGFSMERHLSREHPGLAKLALLKASVTLDGTPVALRTALDEDGRYRFGMGPGAGTLQARLTLENGALADGDHLRLHTPLQALDPDGRERDSHLEVALDVDADLRLRALIPELPGEDIALDADLRLPGTALPLGDWHAQLARAEGSARGRLRMPSIGGVVALFARADWLGLEGSGMVEADLRLADGRLATGSHLRVQDVHAQAQVLGNRFHGSARAEAVIEEAADGSQRSRVNLLLEQFEAAPADAPTRRFVAGSNLRLELESDAHLNRMRDTLQARMRFEQARIPDLTVFNPYLPGGGLRFGGGSGELSGDLRVDADGDVGAGRLRVAGRQARLMVAGMDLKGDIRVDARLRRGNLQRGHFELDGSRVELRNVAFTEPGGASRADWWADIELDDGRLAWQQPTSAGSRVRARMKDVGFLLALFADHADYPGWVGRVVDAGQARLEGRWLWHQDALVLDGVEAGNDRFRLNARLRLRDAHAHGDLLVGWRRLGAGVELEGEQRRFHLRNARQWYESRPPLLR